MDKENKTNRHSECSEGSLLCHCERSDAISYGLPRAHALAMTEVGRSMVEMLGVLAIMGIVGLVGVRMYNVAMNKHHANTLIEQAQRRAVSAASQINLMGHAPSLADFSENTFGGGTFGGVTQEGLSKQFAIQVSGVSKAVCENILSSIGENTSLRRLSLQRTPTEAVSTCSDNNTFLMVYNDDLKGAGGDTEYVSGDCGCQTVCGSCVNQNGQNVCVGECSVNPRQCATNADCSGTCVGCVIAQGNTTGTCQACQRVEYLESNKKQYINTGIFINSGDVFTAEYLITFTDPTFRQLQGFNSGGGGYWGIAANGFYERGGNASTTQPKEKDFVRWNFNRQSQSLFVNNILLSSTGPVTRTGNMYLFALTASNAWSMSAKMYTMRLYLNGDLVRDFIPVHAPFQPVGKQNCMFDKVSGGLFCSQTTTDFIIPSGG